MKEFLFKDINVVLADSDHSYRHTIFNMLRNIGLRKIRQAASLVEIRGVMGEPAADILICEAELSDGKFSDFVYEVRNGDFGNNPFIAMLTVTAEPTKELVRTVIDSGSDDLLTKPLSAAQIKDRITHLIEKRKPFVVTSDYIG
ncbi:MAG TPA: response regulator, partial [Rhodospirillales bacterium]|nr:response regulator [Rhodospirillales bacterium]